MDDLKKAIAVRDNIQGPLYKGWTDLHYACHLSLPECVSILIKEGADINALTEAGSTPLILACHTISQSLDCLKLLLQAGANINVPNHAGWHPLHAACNCDRFIEGVKLIIEAGADINVKNSKGVTPLHLASNRNDMQLVQTLLEAGADSLIKDADGNILPHFYTANKDILELIEGFGGGRATKAAANQ